MIVVGVLAAIVVFAVDNTRKDAVAASCATDLKSILLSAEAMNTHNGLYPVGNPVYPSAGALLKAWPGTGDYTFTYAQTDSGSGYTVTVADVKNADASIGSCTSLTN